MVISKRLRLKNFSSFLLCSFSACTTQGTINLVTYPESADVFLSQGTNKQLLGKSPVKIDLSSVMAPNNPFILIEVKKDDFQTQTLTLPRELQSFNHEIKLSLIPTEISKQTIIQQQKEASENAGKEKCEAVSQETLKNLAQGVAIVQALILRQDYELANVRLATLMTDFPNISVLHDLMGNVYYMRRDYNHALESYRRSLEINPQNTTTAEMVKRLENLTGKSGGIQ